MGLRLEAGQHLCSLWTRSMGLSHHCNLFEAFVVYRTSRPGCLHTSWESGLHSSAVSIAPHLLLVVSAWRDICRLEGHHTYKLILLCELKAAWPRSLTHSFDVRPLSLLRSEAPEAEPAHFAHMGYWACCQLLTCWKAYAWARWVQDNRRRVRGDGAAATRGTRPWKALLTARQDVAWGCWHGHGAALGHLLVVPSLADAWAFNTHWCSSSRRRRGYTSTE